MNNQQTAPISKSSDEILQVSVIGRISTGHQDEENIEASQEYAVAHMHRIYDGEIEFIYLGEQASGMLADDAGRPTNIGNNAGDIRPTPILLPLF